MFDQGYFSLGAKLGLKLFDISLLALLIQRCTHLGGDFKKLYATAPFLHYIFVTSCTGTNRASAGSEQRQ